jgi:ribosome-associated protein
MIKAETRPKTPRLPKQVEAAVVAAEDKKALDLIVLDLRKTGGFTDYFLICSGGNARQLRAIADGVLDARRPGVKPAHVEGYDRTDGSRSIISTSWSIFAQESRMFMGSNVSGQRRAD